MYVYQLRLGPVVLRFLVRAAAILPRQRSLLCTPRVPAAAIVGVVVVVVFLVVATMPGVATVACVVLGAVLSLASAVRTLLHSPCGLFQECSVLIVGGFRKRET